MKKTVTGSFVPFVEDYCHIHGKYGDKVYRRKRNGQPWVYDYEFIPKYDPTVLSRRINCIAKIAATLSNPQYKGYSVIANKLYYYTPYFVFAGRYSFTCNTFLKLRSKGEYGLLIGDMQMQIKLAPRTKLTLTFDEQKTYYVKCYKNGYEYCEREIVVIGDDEDLEGVYYEWFEEHLDEIMQMPEPKFGALRIYRHGIEPPDWLNCLTGKTENGILYRSQRKRFMYIRSSYEHHHVPQGNYFYGVQPRITGCWNAATNGFKTVWEKYHIHWFDANYRKDWKLTGIQNLWSKLVFRAAGELGFDLETLSVDNWLPGVETIGDLIAAAGMGVYGLKTEELNIRIF